MAKKGGGQGTSLLLDDLAMMQNLLKKESVFFRHPTQEKQKSAKAKLANAIEYHPFIRQHKIKEDTAQKIEHSIAKKLIKKAKKDAAIAAFLNAQAEKETCLSDLEDFAKQNKTADDIYKNSLVKHLVHHGKMEAKFLRHDTAQKLIQLAHIAKESQQNQAYLNMTSSSSNTKTQHQTHMPHTKPTSNIASMQINGYKNLSFHLDA